MPSPKHRKKTVTSIQSLDADLDVAQTKRAKAKRKPDMKKMENAGSEGDDKKRSSSAAIIKWANPELHYLTSNLINMISDSWVLRQAFNFDTSDSLGPINGSGKKTADHQHEIASSLLQNDPSGQWVAMDVKTLGIVIKNHINVLKKKYLELYNELGLMGHGLIEDDREDEIWANSVISNIWGKCCCLWLADSYKIQKTFPWYKEMSTLLKSSVVVDKDASANSTTELDLSVLMTQPSGTPRGNTTPLDEEVNDTDHGSEDEELVEGVPGSPHLDEQPESHKNRSVPSCKVTATPSQVTKKNHPSLLDKASELVMPP
ncbi:hypothetical protein K439DRAFT_1615976 [Ramaria rubella]|nr:hypothetical protein K439DRAFT_1615976 [Ramaria rubella]